MGIRRSVWCAGLAGSALVLGLLAAADGPAGAAGADARPTAIVSLGDSAISGEGAGAYEAGTDGPSDYCHRSTRSLIHETGIAVDAAINLGCSGATAENLLAGGSGQYGEASQADQLEAVAARYAVRMLVVEVGANDDPDFSGVLEDCVLAYINPFAHDCATTDGPAWAQHVQAMVPKVDAAIASLRTVMSEDGYAASDYSLVVLSYASPVTENMDAGHAFEGCPIRKADAQWGRATAVPELAAAEARAAAAAGARFLDLAQATYGHEACNDTTSAHWENGLVIDYSQIRRGLNDHVVQQSFHPDAAGHAELGRCLGEFAALSATSGSCVIGADGNLHARAG